MSNWTKVTDDLPESGEDVYVYSPFAKRVDTAFYEEETDNFYLTDNGYLVDVSHWMLIPSFPKPPEEENA